MFFLFIHLAFCFKQSLKDWERERDDGEEASERVRSIISSQPRYTMLVKRWIPPSVSFQTLSKGEVCTTDALLAIFSATLRAGHHLVVKAVPCIASRKLLADNGCPMCRQQKACGQRLSHVSPAGSFLWTMILPLHNLLVDMQWLSSRGAPYIQWLSPSETHSGRLY